MTLHASAARPAVLPEGRADGGDVEARRAWRPAGRLPWLFVGIFAGLVALAGCGAKVKPPVFEEDDPRAAREAAREGAPEDVPEGSMARDGDAGAGAPAPTAGEPVALPPRPLAPPGTQPRTGTIDRAALLGVLDQGPGGFLRGVEIAPSFDGSRFLGWRLEQIVDRASPLYGVDLALGDIIVAVNRRPLARPEHLMALWQELRGADELLAQVWRGAGAFELRFAITPKAAAAPAVTPVPQRPPVQPVKR